MLTIALPADVTGQSTAASPTFDVASVKPNPTGVNASSPSRSGGRIAFEHDSLRDCISFAFGIATGRDYELSGPGWLDTERFDIAATFPPDTSRDILRQMMQTLLIERFRLATHRENKTLLAYELVAAKYGPRLQPGSADADGSCVFGENHVTARWRSMAGLANRLSGPVFRLGRPVVDRTQPKLAFQNSSGRTYDKTPAAN